MLIAVVSTRRFSESDDEWRERLQRVGQRDVVRHARDEYHGVACRVRRARRRARFAVGLLLVGAFALLCVIGIIVLERRFDGFAPLLGVAIPGAVIFLLAGFLNVDFIENHADARDELAAARRTYDEALAEFLAAGGGGDPADGTLLLDRT